MSTFKLQTMRKFQKPVLFALAAFAIVAFGVPWSQLARQHEMRKDGVYAVINGRKITRSEFNEFFTRQVGASPGLTDQYRDNLESYLKQQLILIDEAKKAGLSVSDAEVAEAVKQRLPRFTYIDKVVAAPDEFKDKAQISDEEIEAYYNDHKDSYTVADGDGARPLDEVRGEISSKLQDEKAQELADNALQSFKKNLQGAQYQVDLAFQKAAATAGLTFDRVALYDDENAIKRQLGDLADNKDLTQKLLHGSLGQLLGPYDTDKGKVYFRASMRTPGFDKAGAYHEDTLGWTVNGWGVRKTLKYPELVSEQYRGMQPADMEQAVREQLLVARYRQMLASTTAVPKDTLKQYYYQMNEKARADYLSFNLYDFRPAVQVTDDELRDFYNKYKSNPATRGGAPGYQQPEKVKIEYVLAKKPDAREVNFTDDQLRKYYDGHKDKYNQDFEAAKESVKNDLINEKFDQAVGNLSRAAAAIEQRYDQYVTSTISGQNDEAPMPSMKEAADAFGLTYKESDYIAKDGSNIYSSGLDRDIIMDKDPLLDAAFNDSLMTSTELLTLSQQNKAASRKRVVSSILDTKSGAKYFFRVLDRKPVEQVPFDELESQKEYSRLLATVRNDLTTQKARELAKDKAEKVAVQIRKDAFDAIAKALGVKPEVKPADPNDKSPVAQAAAKLQDGQMSGVIENGDKLAIVYSEKGDKDLFNWHILSFGKDQQIPALPLTDVELADYLDKNVENFADYLPLTGTATIQYIAAKYDKLAKDVELTDAEIEKYYNDHKADFEGQTLDEARPAVVEAAKLAQAKTKADELIKKAYDTAKADDSKYFGEIVKDTPLVADYASSIKLDNVADQDFIGKAENLGRTILATKKNELVAPLKTEDGEFFFKIYSKNIGKGTDLLDKLSDDGKKALNDAVAKAQAAGTPAQQATVQVARYVRDAFAAAPEKHQVVINSKLNLQVTADSKLSNGASEWTTGTVEQLLGAKPGTVVGPITDGNRVALFNVKNVQNLQAMKIEYVALSWQDFAKAENNDFNTAIDKGTELAQAAAEKVYAAAKGGASVTDALKAVEGQIKPMKPLRATTTPWVSIGSMNTMLPPQLLSKMADLKPGQLASLDKFRNAFYVARLVDAKPATEAKVHFVRVNQKDFITGDTNAQDALKKAEDALKAYRAEAEKQGSLEAALPSLQTQIPNGAKVQVEGSDSFISLTSPPPTLLGKRKFLEALQAAKPGQMTDVIRDGASFYVASVSDVRQPKSVTVDWATLYNYGCSDPLAISDEQLKAYFDAHKEDYRRDKQLEIATLATNDGSFKDKATKQATDDALKAYFEANKAKYQPAAGDDQAAAVKFEDVKDAVKRDFVMEKSTDLATKALADAKAKLAAQDADIEAVAKETGAEYRSLGYQTRQNFDYRTEYKAITGLSDVLFAMNKGDVSQIQSKGADHYLFKITDVKEAYIPEFADVKNEVRPDADKELQPERAQKAAADMKAEIEKAMADGKTFEQAANDASVEFPKHKQAAFKTTDTLFSRMGRPEGLMGDSDQFKQTAFSLHPGQVSQPVAEDFERQAVRLLTLRDFLEPETPTSSDLENVKYRIEYEAGQQLVNDTLTNVTLQAQMSR